ncbi:hypothetical protein K443DRAFT_129738 [Laccaria amethystina LaAM-08-1]|uniref:Small ribosomal subunit protein bS18m n=1 Tax=Laccaria amethystina LaAM-08-1 TaxID=1095629 RepID=A0A0C9Y979_9AGAR|nr:hypothetical protein K443DRAFT_129738 [Laccaria amethystina LaAM-08-1]
MMLGRLRPSSLSLLGNCHFSPLSSSSTAVFSTSSWETNALIDILQSADATTQSKAHPSKSVATVDGWKPFKTHSVVRPHELTYKARSKNSRPFRKQPAIVGPSPAEARYNDPFHQLNLDPLSFSTNALVLSNFISEMGKIYGRPVTGLTTKSQRKLGKAIRRAKMMGIIPNLSRPSDSWMFDNRKPTVAY